MKRLPEPVKLLLDWVRRPRYRFKVRRLKRELRSLLTGSTGRSS